MVRLLPPPPRIGRVDETLHVRAPLVVPPLQMPLAQPMAARGSPAAADPAGGSAEHRVLRPEFQYIAAEFAADSRHQLSQEPGRIGIGQSGRGGHTRTCRSVNQPACSMTRRASSTLRCP
ncbi:hypothetical protein BMW24_023355 [Mycobacterium heckeshornense]|nr:hypothetical protein BMW24_023355 [Mycobacterium heckeshornense]